MLLKYIYIVLILLLAVPLYKWAQPLIHDIQKLRSEKYRESRCITQHISMGIERINIITHKGTCTVKH